MKALIAGAGIGGLTTALFLHRAGIEVEIFERADAVRELGVGINRPPPPISATEVEESLGGPTIADARPPS